MGAWQVKGIHLCDEEDLRNRTDWKWGDPIEEKGRESFRLVHFRVDLWDSGPVPDMVGGATVEHFPSVGESGSRFFPRHAGCGPEYRDTFGYGQVISGSVFEVK